METNYHPLIPDEAKRAAFVIASAFMDDPLASFILPFRRSRFHTLNKFFLLYAQINIEKGCAFGVGEPPQGIAFWEFPDQEPASIRLSSLVGLLPLIFTVYPLGLFRARKIIAKTNEMHQKYASFRHYYLDNLGVLETARGKGLASLLLRPVLEQADAQGIPVYTDTVTRANVSLYEHFGFVCQEEAAIPGTGVTVFALFRQPAGRL